MRRDTSMRSASVPGAIAQFHGDETPDQCGIAAATGASGSCARPAFPSGGGRGFDLVKYASDYSHAQAILLDAHVEGYGGGGKAFDWSLLPPAVDAHLVLSGGLTPANVGDGIRSLRTRCKIAVR
jgi:phosphoribosylanthranilate isomerase